MPRMQEFSFTAYGVSVVIASPPDLEAAIRKILPPGAVSPGSRRPHVRFSVTEVRGAGWRLTQGQDILLVEGSTIDTLLDELGATLREHVALHAPDRIFVHAGVVGVDGLGLVVPGQSFAGKSTLIEALVRAGAVYYSDEFAVLDDAGRIFPFSQPISRRVAGFFPNDEEGVDAGEFGEVSDGRPLALALVAAAEYRPGATWSPRTLSQGQGALLLLDNTVPARSRPEASLQAVRAAVDGAVILEGPRGEAEETAATLMAELRRLAAQGGV
jgi:hypothetical protein